jgi:predicted Rossmann-fold nucleotide-binding protein
MPDKTVPMKKLNAPWMMSTAYSGCLNAKSRQSLLKVMQPSVGIYIDGSQEQEHWNRNAYKISEMSTFSGMHLLNM